MESVFKVKDKICKVTLSERMLVFEHVTSEFTANNTQCGIVSTNSIAVKDILSVNYQPGTNPSVKVHHVVPHTNKRLRQEVCDMHGETNACQQFAVHISSLVNALTRPKRLLVFVNPKSGHKKAVKIYTSKVAPLLKQCGIHTELIVTDRAGQPKELLSTYDLRLIHGIVSIGGDGMFSECVNGLLARLQNDSHVDMHDPDAEIAASNIPIGIVPAGSGNYLVNYIHGTRDVETAALKILLGDHHLSNVVSLHQGRNLTCYSSLLVEFGLIGNMIHDCERFRWLGPSRYSVIPVTSLAKRKPIDVEIEYLPEEKSRSSPKATLTKYIRQVSLPANQITNRFLRNRQHSSPNDYDIHKRKTGWKKLEGRVYGVDTYVVTQKEKDESVKPMFGDSALTMWLTDKCSMSDHVEQLTKIQKAQIGYLDYEFVRQVRTTRYRVKLPTAHVTRDDDGHRMLLKKYYINVDGEAVKLEYPEFDVKLHQLAMPIYGKIEN